MNQVYKNSEFIIIPVCNNFLIINTNKIFKKGHTHVNKFGIAKLLIDLSIKKEVPKNPYFVDNLIRITKDESYIRKLKEFKEYSFLNYKDLMKNNSYRRIHGYIRQVKHE